MWLERTNTDMFKSWDNGVTIMKYQQCSSSNLETVWKEFEIKSNEKSLRWRKFVENSHIISTIVLVIKWVGNLYPISRIVGLTFQPFPIIVQFLTRLQQQQNLLPIFFLRKKWKVSCFQCCLGLELVQSQTKNNNYNLYQIPAHFYKT